MSIRPQTIQIYLPGGVPHGIRIAELTTRIVQVVEVPRALLSEFLAMPDNDRVSVYLLHGEDDSARQKVYIGQTSNLPTRLNTHQKEKDFWERALVIQSKTNSLTQTHALYLEWLCLQEAKKANRYLSENGNAGSKPHTPAPMQADCDEIFDTAKVLLATLGYAVFDPVLTQQEAAEGTPYFCEKSGAKAEGKYTPEGFVVLSGSTGRAEVSSSFENTHTYGQLRRNLINQGKLEVRAGKLVFLDNVLFASPSAAAAVVAGTPSSGWKEWRTRDGRTLEELERRKPT
ncbi:excinuclease ABC subunit C [Burkholderia cenocepacia]|nr:excinuclease ABC subunit C [Burkholderia cenocepacia]